MLRNHGLLTTGRTVPEAFLRLYRLERACQIQVDAAAAGTLNIMGDNLAGKSGADMDRFAESEYRHAATSNSPPSSASSTRSTRAGGTRAPPGAVKLGLLVQVAQRATGPLDVGDAPAEPGSGPDRG